MLTGIGSDGGAEGRVVPGGVRHCITGVLNWCSCGLPGWLGLDGWLALGVLLGLRPPLFL